MRCLLFASAILYGIRLGSANSTLLSGGTIISFDSGSESLHVVRNGSLLVTDDRIAGIFSGNPPSGQVPNGTNTIDVTGKIISPGFIDTHKHGWQTAFKTLASNTTLSEYFLRYGEFASAGLLTPDDVYLGQLTGLYEALNSGTTTILDHAHHTWSNDTAEAGLRGSIDSGARVFWAYTFHNVTNFTIGEQIPNFRDIATKGSFKGTATSLGLAIDFIGISPNLPEINAVMSLVDEFNVSVLTTHYLNGPWAATNSPANVNALGYLNISTPWVFSHGSYMTYGDASLLRSTNQYLSVTPESEMHYGHLHQDSHLILDQAALGVDTHFTYSGDILSQSRIFLQATRYTLYEEVGKHWTIPGSNPMSVNQAFLLATRAGGLALRRQDLGVLAVGAKADLVVWDGDSPALLGWVDPVAAIVLHASVGDVDSVMVDGKWVKKDGKLTASGYADVRTRFLASARRIQKVLIETPLPPQNGTFNGAGSLAPTFPVDAQRGPGDGYGTTFLASDE